MEKTAILGRQTGAWKHFKQQGMLAIITNNIICVCVCFYVCVHVHVPGSECESVHGGGRPADIQRPAVRPRL